MRTTGFGREQGGHDACYDAVCYPDYDTFDVLPWVENTARIYVEPTFNGKPVEVYPRTIARRLLDELKDLGYSLLTAHEHEYTVVHGDTREPITDDNLHNATLRNNKAMKLIYQAMRQLPKVGVDVEKAESEAGRGAYEITYLPNFGIRAGDNAQTFKIAMKEMAVQHNYHVSFMTCPYEGEAQCALQVCHSLWAADEKTPLLYDPDEPTKLTEVGRHWIAGLLAHAPAITVLMAPTINCLSIMQRDSRSPHVANWGMDDRTCALRVKLNGPKGTYFENRLGGGSSNPYLTLAATVAAGMDGIKRKLDLPKEQEGGTIAAGTAKIPNNMKDALKAFLEDKVITDAFGPEFVKAFEACKIHEMKVQEKELAKGKTDTEWQREYYFEYL